MIYNFIFKRIFLNGYYQKNRLVEDEVIIAILDYGFFLADGRERTLCIEHANPYHPWEKDECTFASTITAVIKQIMNNAP